MRKFLKRKWVQAVAVILGAFFLGSAAIMGVRAYLTDGEEAMNTLETAFVSTETEPTPQPPFVTPEYQKRISVKNTGNVECFVRVRVEFSDGYFRDWSGFSSDGVNYYSANVNGRPSYVLDETASGILADAYVNHLPEGWVYIPEDSEASVHYEDDYHNVTAGEGELLGGYYYYTIPLQPGETTENLTERVKTYFKDTESKMPYDIIVYTEAVQTSSHTGAKYTGENAWKQMWTEVMARKN